MTLLILILIFVVLPLTTLAVILPNGKPSDRNKLS